MAREAGSAPENRESPGRSVPTPTLPIKCLPNPALVFSLKCRGTEQRFRPGQTISYEDHHPVGIYLHEAGRLSFLRGRAVVGCCCEPCLLGLQALAAEGRFSVSICAGSNVRVTFFSRWGWERIQNENPDLRQFLNEAIRT
ncbi:MAG: hypothetical protein HYY13_11655 [Nitrospirae bacterium]|nr:hypothetical protein [Nitrospirota bacterium]